MHLRYRILLYCILLYQHAYSQIRITGYVQDAETHRGLTSAVIKICNNPYGVLTDEFGYFTIYADSIPICINISYVNYENKQIIIQDNIVPQFIYLQNKILDEVIISGITKSPEQNIDIVQIPIERLKKMPSIIGEPDIMKSIAIAPGINNTQEGSSAMTVRGGNPDQNLYLLDGMMIFNPHHLLGFFSVFNPSTIQDLKVYKGDFPAKYGNRLSSVVELTTKEGPNTGYAENEFTLGTISSNLYLEGSLKENTSAFSIAARSAYLNLLLLPQKISVANSGYGTYNNYWLYDLNCNVYSKIGKAGKLKINLFHNRDIFTNTELYNMSENEIDYKWGNTSVGINYKNILNSKTTIQTLVSYADYNFNAKLKQETASATDTEEYTFSDVSNIRDIQASLIFKNYVNSKTELTFGLQQNFTTVSPNNTSINYSINNNTVFENDTFAFIYKIFNTAAYFDSEIDLTPFINVHAGIRFNALNTTNYSQYSPEPRLSISILPNDSSALKLAYTFISQPYHLISASSSGFPNDVWLPATEITPSETANQYSVGYFFQSYTQKMKLSAELYYKSFSNLISFSPGQLSLFNISDSWEERIYNNGKGYSYGIELYFEKEWKRIDMLASYTFSRSLRKFEEINNGAYFPSKYDIINDIAISMNYAHSEKWSFQSQFVFQSGRPVTVPDGLYFDDAGQPNYIYSAYNAARLPVYHRFDISFTNEKKINKYKTRKWIFGIYNVYARKNPYYLENNFDYIPIESTAPTGFENNITQVTLFRIVPSISYNLQF